MHIHISFYVLIPLPPTVDALQSDKKADQLETINSERMQLIRAL